MIHPIKLIVVRRQNYIIEHFENSRFAKRIRTLHNIHNGKRCFIVANGPSLTKEDLDLLSEHNEITFGMNRIFKIFDDTKWRPTYYVCEDINIFNECIDEINSIPAEGKFIPINHHFYDNINIDNAYYFFANYIRENDCEGSFSSDISKQMDCLGTVTFTCMNIAVYMGFTEIYLLGVDHNYHITIDENGNTIVDDNAKDYFCDDYDNDIQDIVVHNMGANTIAYQKAKKYCDKNGIKIINATRGGKLEVFPREDFDNLF